MRRWLRDALRELFPPDVEEGDEYGDEFDADFAFFLSDWVRLCLIVVLFLLWCVACLYTC